jgi:hypothetical protein
MAYQGDDSGTDTIAVREEGTPKGHVGIVDFAGAGATVTVDRRIATVTVPGAADYAEAATTPVAGATSTALGADICVFAFFTLPTTSQWYVVTGIEWLNKATVNGNVWCGVSQVNASPPTLAETVNVATGAPVAQTGASAAQRNSVISSKLVPGGAVLGAWFVSDSATGTFGNTAVTSANNRKAIAAGSPTLADNTAWTASTAQYYVKCYYRAVA